MQNPYKGPLKTSVLQGTQKSLLVPGRLMPERDISQLQLIPTALFHQVVSSLPHFWGNKLSTATKSTALVAQHCHLLVSEECNTVNSVMYKI